MFTKINRVAVEKLKLQIKDGFIYHHELIGEAAFLFGIRYTDE